MALPLLDRPRLSGPAQRPTETLAGSRLFDAVVIGGGPSGVVVATSLAAMGWDVLVLEEGAAHVGGEGLAELRDAAPGAMTRDDAGRWSAGGVPWTARVLGGGSTLFAGIAFRYRMVDFDPSSHVTSEALPPAWPIDYEDLQPHYDFIEREIGVARAAGADPLEPRGAPPPMPPHTPSPQARVIEDAALRLGLRPFPTPLAINSVPYRGAPACDRSSVCSGQACRTGAKGDVVTRLLRRDFNGRLTVRLAARAVKLLQDKPGCVSAVEWLDGASRERRRSRARVFVVAANAVQSAALLLRSRSKHSPAGLGNDCGMVGRGLSFKVSGYVVGRLTGTAAAQLTGRAGLGPHSTVAISDYYLDDRCPGGLGGILYDTLPTRPPVEPRIRLHYLLGDQPMARNRVQLLNATDAAGLPRIGFDYTTHRLDLRRQRYMTMRAKEILLAGGAEDVHEEDSYYRRGSSHLHGTCRSGDDRSCSVVDRDGRVHGVDNVYVADGGFMPFAGGVNPTLTIQANARRIALAVHAGHHP